MKNLWIWDSESDGFLEEMTKFHVLTFKNHGEDEWVVFIDKSHAEYELALEYCTRTRDENITVYDVSHFNVWVTHQRVKALACHFKFGFDLPALAKILGTKYDYFPQSINGSPTRLYDTLSMSQGLYPDRMVPRGCPMSLKCPVTGKSKKVGGHGLQSWGYRVGNMKPSIDDWRDQPLCVYINRCIEDVIINEGTWDELVKEMNVEAKYKVDWKIPLKRNMEADYLMGVQHRQGVVFDIPRAEALRDRIDKMQEELEREVEPLLPKREMPKSEQPKFPAKPFNGSGNFSADGIKWLKKLGYEFEDDILNAKPPPKTAFKACGSLSVAGKNYCIKQGVEDENLMPDFIRSQITLCERSVFVGGAMAEAKARGDIADKRMPDIMVPMKISNQADIKKYLVETEGWNPTIWGTKDATKDDRKQKVDDKILEQRLKDYIQYVYDSPFRDFIYRELDMVFHNYKKESTLIDKLKRKARNLITTPKFKDERGVLCPSLEFLKGKMAKEIVKWLSLRNRRSVIQTKDPKKNTGWLNNERLLVDNKLSAAYTGLTNTNRRKHTVVANVPKNDPDVLLGKEMRELFTVPEGMWQIGTDASNLEGFVAAWLAWDYDDGAYYHSLSGDPHTTNAKAYSEAAGRDVGRGEGKAITYGVMYGAQANKVASMLGISVDAGQAVIDAFWETNYGLKGAKDALVKYWKATGKKWILGIDGRKIFTRSEHSLLNARIQSTGALLCDLAGVIWHRDAVKHRLLDKGVARTIYYHDEYQHQIPDSEMHWKKFDTQCRDGALVKKVVEASKKAKKKRLDIFEITKGLNLTNEEITTIVSAYDTAEDFTVEGRVLAGNVRIFEDGMIGKGYTKAGELMVRAFEQAGRELNCPIEISGEYMVGKSWGECH